MYIHEHIKSRDIKHFLFAAFANHAISRNQRNYDSIITRFSWNRALRERLRERMTCFRKVVIEAIYGTLQNVRYSVGAISIPVIKIPRVIEMLQQDAIKDDYQNFLANRVVKRKKNRTLRRHT